VKDCDPNTGEPDDEGYEDEYVVSMLWNFVIHSFFGCSYLILLWILLRWYGGAIGVVLKLQSRC